MTLNSSISDPQPAPAYSIVYGDCIQVMHQANAQSVDFILTDPPYLVNYRDRSGRAILNDADQVWLKPAFAEAYRVLREGRFMISFYSWTHADKFLRTWREAGFRVIGHLVFRKQYCSQTRFLGYSTRAGVSIGEGTAEASRSTDLRRHRHAL